MALQGALPPIENINILVDYFFQTSTVHWHLSILDRPVFEASLRHYSSAIANANLDFIGLLAALCACSLQFLPDGGREVFLPNGSLRFIVT